MNSEEQIMIDDSLRPQSTFDFKNQYQAYPYDFPNLYIDKPFPIKMWNPVDTYASDMNTRFSMRYEKNPSSK